MKDKYLCQDGINEKYGSRSFLINSFKYAGTFGGGAFALLSVSKAGSVEEVLISGGVGIGSYFLGDYLNKVNDNKKEKALKNVEARLLAEGRK